MPVLSEKRTEEIAREMLEVRGWNTARPPKGNVLWQNEYREYPHLRAAFAAHSKSGAGPGYPDFVVIDPTTVHPLIVGETKRHPNDINEASEDAVHYASALIDRGYPTLAVGIAGNATEEIAVKVNKRTESGHWELIKFRDDPIRWVPTPSETTALIADRRLFELEPQVPTEETLAKRADEINRIFRECKIADANRAGVIGAFMLGLVRTRGNVRTDTEHVLPDINLACEKAFTDAGKSELAGSIMVPEANHALAARAPEIIYILRLLNLTTLTAAHDYLGQLYETFFRFTGGNTIGQFFTPRHITRFVVSLCQISPEDILVDPTCGTGGFLIAALYRMLGSYPFTQAEITKLVAKHLLGFESEPITAALCVANMIIRGDGTTGVKLGDCFTDPRYPKTEATAAVGNPPFPHKQSDDQPEKFVSRALEALKPRGKCAMVVPASLLSKADKIGWRKNVLAHNTLRAVITLPRELFEPYAASTTAIIMFEKGIPHQADTQTFFCHISNDGYRLKKNSRIPRAGEQLSQAEQSFNDHTNVPGLCSFARLEGFDKGSEWSSGAFIATAEHDSEDIISEVDSLVAGEVSFHALHARDLADFGDALASGQLTTTHYRGIADRKVKKATTSLVHGSIGSLFDMYYGLKELHSKEHLLPGHSLIISAQGRDNGCYGFYSFENLIAPPFVTVPSTGSIGEANVQLWPCGVSDDCVLLIPKEGTTDEQLWIAAATIRLERWRFNYGRKITPSRIANFVLKKDPDLEAEVRRLIDAALPSARAVVQALSGQTPPIWPSEVKTRFEALASQWKAETALISNIRTIVLHPAYQQIIGIGERAVPLILEALNRGDYDEWFWALRAITGEDPVPLEHAGNVQEMAKAWLQWGTRMSYLSVSPQNPRPHSQTSLNLDI